MKMKTKNFNGTKRHGTAPLLKIPILFSAAFLTTFAVSVTGSPLYPEHQYDKDMTEMNIEERNWIHADEARRFYTEYMYQNHFQGVNVGLFDSCYYESHPDLHFAELGFNYADQPYMLESSKKEIAYMENPTDDVESDSHKRHLEDFGYLIHGTHVAGILGAVCGNGIGIDGMYPGAYTEEYQPDGTLKTVCRLYAYDYSDGAENVAYSWENGIAWLLDRDVKVINCSSGVYGETNEETKDGGRNMATFLQDYIDAGRDFLIVIASGNDSETEAEYSNFLNAISEDEFPEVYSRIIVVGGRKRYNPNMEYSLGERVDLMAAGEIICSTSPEGYICLDGTSFATPQVSGAAAMVWSILKESGQTNIGPLVKDILISTASPGAGDYLTLDAERAVQKAILLTGDPTGVLAGKKAMPAEPVSALPTDGYMYNPGWTEDILTGVLGESRNVDLDGDWLIDTLDTYFYIQNGSLHLDLQIQKGSQTVAHKDVNISPWFISAPLYMPLQINVMVAKFPYEQHGAFIILEYMDFMEDVDVAAAVYEYAENEIRFTKAFSFHDMGSGSVFLFSSETEDNIFGGVGEKYFSSAWHKEIDWQTDDNVIPLEKRRSAFDQFCSSLSPFGIKATGARFKKHAMYDAFAEDYYAWERAFLSKTAKDAYIAGLNIFAQSPLGSQPSVFKPLTYVCSLNLAHMPDSPAEWVLIPDDTTHDMDFFRNAD